MKPYRVSISCLKFRTLGFERKDKQGPMHKQTLRFKKHSRQNIHFLLHLNTLLNTNMRIVKQDGYFLVLRESFLFISDSTPYLQVNR